MSSAANWPDGDTSLGAGTQAVGTAAFCGGRPELCPDVMRLPGADALHVNVLVIVNDQPYGSERPYNAFRLAGALSKREDVDVRVFLMGDAVACAVAGQRLPDGHYHLDRMLKPLVRRARVGC